MSDAQKYWWQGGDVEVPSDLEVGFGVTYSFYGSFNYVSQF